MTISREEEYNLAYAETWKLLNRCSPMEAGVDVDAEATSTRDRRDKKGSRGDNTDDDEEELAVDKDGDIEYLVREDGSMLHDSYHSLRQQQRYPSESSYQSQSYSQSQSQSHFASPSLCSTSNAFFVAGMKNRRAVAAYNGNGNGNGSGSNSHHSQSNSQSFVFALPPKTKIVNIANRNRDITSTNSTRSNNTNSKQKGESQALVLESPIAGISYLDTLECNLDRLERELGLSSSFPAASSPSSSSTADAAHSSSPSSDSNSSQQLVDTLEYHHTITTLTSLVLNNNHNNNNNNNTNKNNNPITNPVTALTSLQTLGDKIPKRVCQHPFKRNDIVWVCRTCQSDETCVLCHKCFDQSDHTGHDVAFYHAQAGGCCDCGDADAWDPRGFCPRHGVGATLSNGGEVLGHGVEDRVAGIVSACGQWLVRCFALNVEWGYCRVYGSNANGVANNDHNSTMDEAVLAVGTGTGINHNQRLRRKRGEHDWMLGYRDVYSNRNQSTEQEEGGEEGEGDGGEEGELESNVDSAGINRYYWRHSDTVSGGNNNNSNLNNTLGTASVNTTRTASDTRAMNDFRNVPEDEAMQDALRSVHNPSQTETTAVLATATAATTNHEENDDNISIAEMSIDTDHHRDLTFDPEAASTSKSRSALETDRIETEMMERIVSPSSAHDDHANTRNHSHNPTTNTNNNNDTTELVFDPEAASTSKSLQKIHSPNRTNNTSTNTASITPPSSSATATSQPPRTTITNINTHHQIHHPNPYSTPNTSPAQQLGEIGSAHHGLYLILHADDVHTDAEVIQALRTLYAPTSSSQSPSLLHHHHHYHRLDSLLAKLVKILRKTGDLIVWGTHELLSELGPVQSHCWRDGDPRSCANFGNLVLRKARILSRPPHQMVVSIKTYRELSMEVRAASVVRFLSALSGSCDPLCYRVSVGLGGVDDDDDGTSGERCVKVGAARGKFKVKGMGDDPTLILTSSSATPTTEGCLVPMLRNDLKLPRSITGPWHALLLTLLAVPNFKAALANAYCDTYRKVTSEYAGGAGILDRSLYTLSVQFLNRVTYVQDLVKERDLLGCLGRSLLETLSVAAVLPGRGHRGGGGSTSGRSWTATAADEFVRPWTLPPDPSRRASGGSSFGNRGGWSGGNRFSMEDWTGKGGGSGVGEDQYREEDTGAISLVRTLDPLHPVLSHRRYSPCISDLKCVLNVPGMARLFSSLPSQEGSGKGGGDFGGRMSPSSCLDAWVESLSLGQNMDGQIWRSEHEGHVETEPKGWVGAFNASISLGSLFERLLSWEDDDPLPIMDLAGSCIETNKLLTSVELAHYVLTTGVTVWQASEMVAYKPTPNTSHRYQFDRCPASLPMSTIASKHGTWLAMRALPVAQTRRWSFHLPLHRFVAACLREVARRPCVKADGSAGGMEELLLMFCEGIGDNSGKHRQKSESLFRGLMEFPVVVLARAAQIRSGLWRRNGPGMLDQVLNYAEPPFCRALRDADMALIQFALLGYTQSTQDADKHAGNGSAHVVNLLLHRFGIFDFAGFSKAPNGNVRRYSTEIGQGLYQGEKVMNDMTDGKSQTSPSPSLPWSYNPAKDAATSLSLLEELFHTLIILITELPPPPPKDTAEHTSQAKERLRREVIHRLASGPKTHSELAEVHHVLAQRDNLVLSEEGKLVNPDDATGAALEVALGDVAHRRISRGRLAPDQWELRRSAWDEYDPGFFHIGLRSHQSAAENRPSGTRSKAYTPAPPSAHPSFLRIRRDITADSCVIALAYRTLHVHCSRSRDPPGDTALDFIGRSAYLEEAKSETILARAVHILTLGVYAWINAPFPGRHKNDADPTSWRKDGGGEKGSVFYDYSRPPDAKDWIEKALLGDPRDIMDSDCYRCEENSLLLLNRLAVDGGSAGVFIAQDRAIRSGAAWICDFAISRSPSAAALLGKDCGQDSQDAGASARENDLQRRKREAKERALQQMQARMAKFEETLEESDNDSLDRLNKTSHVDHQKGNTFSKAVLDRSGSKDSTLSQNSFDSDSKIGGGKYNTAQSFDSTGVAGTSQYENEGTVLVPRLFSNRPRCIICGDDSSGLVDDSDTQDSASGEVDMLKHPDRKSRRNSEKVSGTMNSTDRTAKKQRGDKVLAYCGYAQASTVLKVVGGYNKVETDISPASLVGRFVGTHFSTCGHAVHSSCCESYLKDLARREDRTTDRLEGGKKGEFKCPLCKQLSNCLVPFIDVGADWIAPITDSQMDLYDESEEKHSFLHNFLNTSKWWALRNDASVIWDGRCSFLPAEETSQSPSQPRTSIRKKVRPFGKKDLYMAWSHIMRTPRFVRKGRNMHAHPASEPLAHGYDISAYMVDNALVNSTSNEFGGVMEVWRRLMDQLADVSYKGDNIRLGEDELIKNFGEFRHYHVERAAYNVENRAAGNETTEWPACLNSKGPPDKRKQELSREKLLSKLLLSIHAFTYSCCSEVTEFRRLLRKKSPSGDFLHPAVIELYSKYGISSVSCGGEFVILAESSLSKDGGTTFEGRIGKLRYLALAVMAATSAVSREIVQLALSFPEVASSDLGGQFYNKSEHETGDEPRAPVIFPLLCGHVVTHIVAAMCAVCGHDRFIGDSFTRTTNVMEIDSDQSDSKNVYKPSSEMSFADCDQFIKLGFVAKILQVLLGVFQLELLHPSDGWSKGDIDSWESKIRSFNLRCDKELNEFETNNFKWKQNCFLLMKIALGASAGKNSTVKTNANETSDEDHVEKVFSKACAIAIEAACTYLCDMALLLQVLVPGKAVEMKEKDTMLKKSNAQKGFLELAMFLIGIEPLEDLLKSPLVCEVVRNWYSISRPRSDLTCVADKVDCKRVYRAIDWPIVETSAVRSIKGRDQSLSSYLTGSLPFVCSNKSILQQKDATSISVAFEADVDNYKPMSSLSRTFKKSVPLFGECCVRASDDDKSGSPPRIKVLPTSYTDLYAELDALTPDSEQTALCLVCGEVMNAGGKGECTKHAFKCGGGSGIFFLLQECVSLIFHNKKAAYVHSPYVDSHGETPQYRGRPLNLDIDRYDILHELWSGHLVRQKVMSERANSRQVIISDFY